MKETAFPFVVSLIASLMSGYCFMCVFRKLKTGVKSPYIPDRNTLSDNKKTIGSAFAVLVGALTGFLSTSFLLEESEVLKMLCAFVLCAGLTLSGFEDDKRLDLKGENAGMKASYRVLFTLIISLAFSLMYMAFGFDTVVTLPFSKGGVRLGFCFGPVISLVTLLATEGMRASGNTKGTETGRGAVYLAGVFALCTVNGNPEGMKISALFVGAVMGAVYWTLPPCILKTGFSDRNLISAMVVSGCIITDNEGALLFFTAFEIICLIAKPVDKIHFRLSGKRIFSRLPLDEHLKSLKYSERKIYLFYVISSAVFTAVAVLVKIAIYNLN